MGNAWIQETQLNIDSAPQTQCLESFVRICCHHSKLISSLLTSSTAHDIIFPLTFRFEQQNVMLINLEKGEIFSIKLDRNCKMSAHYTMPCRSKYLFIECFLDRH